MTASAVPLFVEFRSPDVALSRSLSSEDLLAAFGNPSLPLGSRRDPVLYPGAGRICDSPCCRRRQTSIQTP
jgi:hypothetical protein